MEEQKIGQVAVVIFRNSKGEFLLGKRAENSSLAPSFWEFPGGKLEADELAELAAQREIKEELGYELNQENLVPLIRFQHTYDFGTVDLSFFTYDIDDNVIFKPMVHSELKFVSLRRLWDYNLLEAARVLLNTKEWRDYVSSKEDRMKMVSPRYLEILDKNFSKKKAHEMAISAPLQQVGIEKASLNPDVLRSHDFSFSLETNPPKEASAQRASGRCWIFAAMNAAETLIRKQLDTDEFKLSPTYLLFFEKLEKSNSFLENMLTFLDLEDHDPKLHLLYEDAAHDGGLWEWSQDLVQKYGICDAKSMPETASSVATKTLNTELNLRLLRTAAKFRALAKAQKANGSDSSELWKKLQALKEESLKEVYTILCRCLGTPPKTIAPAYKTKKGEKKRLEPQSPQAFYKKYFADFAESCIVLMHDPRELYPEGTRYRTPLPRLVYEGEGYTTHLASLDTLKACAIKAIEAGEGLWFACDVGASSNRELGILDTDVYLSDAFLSPLDADGFFDKKQKLEVCASRLTHAMLLCGVERDENGKPLRWKVENSWGTSVGDKGFFSMSDKWFDEYLYELVVPRKYFEELCPNAKTAETVVLDFWDPMSCAGIRRYRNS